VLIDQFSPSDSKNADGTAYSVNTSVTAQLPWISTQLSGRAANTHGFVFSHKGLVTENHVDTLFGTNPADNKTGQDTFIKTLANNGVRYLQHGHDHIYHGLHARLHRCPYHADRGRLEQLQVLHPFGAVE
jgi:hypothetical protein